MPTVLCALLQGKGFKKERLPNFAAVLQYISHLSQHELCEHVRMQARDMQAGAASESASALLRTACMIIQSRTG